MNGLGRGVGRVWNLPAALLAANGFCVLMTHVLSAPYAVAPGLALGLLLPGLAVVLAVEPTLPEGLGPSRLAWSVAVSIILDGAGVLLLVVAGRPPRRSDLALVLLGTAAFASVAAVATRARYASNAARPGSGSDRSLWYGLAALCAVVAGISAVVAAGWTLPSRPVIVMYVRTASWHRMYAGMWTLGGAVVVEGSGLRNCSGLSLRVSEMGPPMVSSLADGACRPSGVAVRIFAAANRHDRVSIALIRAGSGVVRELWLYPPPGQLGRECRLGLMPRSPRPVRPAAARPAPMRPESPPGAVRMCRLRPHESEVEERCLATSRRAEDFPRWAPACPIGAGGNRSARILDHEPGSPPVPEERRSV